MANILYRTSLGSIGGFVEGRAGCWWVDGSAGMGDAVLAVEERVLMKKGI